MILPGIEPRSPSQLMNTQTTRINGWYIYIYIYIYISELVTVVKGDPNAYFSIATKPRYKTRHYSVPCIGLLALDLYLIMLSVKQKGIKWHF